MKLTGIVLAACGILHGAGIHAQTWPAKPVRVVVPFPAGGAVDVGMRTVGAKLSEIWKQPVVVENRGGAGGNIGAEIVAKAAPDGYTLLCTSNALALSTALYRKLPYDAAKDFQGLVQFSSSYLVLVSDPTMPVASVRELLAYAKGNAGKMTFGSTGVGAAPHLVMEQFKHASGVPSMAVPYKSIGQAFTDSMSGQIQVIFPGLAAAMPHVKTGAFKPLAVTADKRQAVLPNVPTFKELGYEGFEGLTWYGVMGPAKLPPTIVKRLNDEINKILASPDLRETFNAQALNVMPMSPPQFGKYVADEIAHWTAVAKASKIEAD
jgi:tripartite-type tricarboxylate transporter receptor subunit TctC